MNSPGSQPDLRVADLGERALIGRIRARMPPAPPSLLVGIGDDAAVAAGERGTLQVLTTDAVVEGVHFDRRFSSPADIGYKALAVNVSDVAAMGGTPRFALLSLMLPEDLPVADIDGLFDGLLEMAARCGVTLAGGNITRSPGPFVVDVTAVGSVKPRKVLTRGGGRPGDALYVTGEIGAGVAGLAWLRAAAADRQPPGGREVHAPPADGSDAGRIQATAPQVARPEDPDLAACVARHCRPEPRVRIGALLGRNRAATACMDLSDGLADGIAQIAAASGTGAKIEADLLPVHPGAAAWFARTGQDPVAASLAGGDDYELLFAVARRRRGRLRTVLQEARGVRLTRIGELTAAPEIVLVRDGRTGPLPSGFTHF